MRRKPNTIGGGAKTNLNGLIFEGRTDLLTSIDNHPDFTIQENQVFKNNILIGEYYEKHDFYKNFLTPMGVKYNKINSKKYLPDSIFYNIKNQTIYVIEKKFQAAPGSVDEKLQTCDFKKKVYQKLANKAGLKVEYYYLLNDWFNRNEYNDVFEYIESVNCKYFIEFIPLKELGI